MKNKSLLVVLLLLVSCLIICCESARAEPPQNLEFEPVELIDEQGDHIQVFAQNEVDPNIVQPSVNANYTNNTPTGLNSYTMPDTSLIDRYGLVGFVVLTSMGLVVYIVKQDRKSMGDFTISLDRNAQAIGELAGAVTKLSLNVQAEVREMGSNFALRFDAVEKAIERIDQRDG